jgi:hypothetical protein
MSLLINLIFSELLAKVRKQYINKKRIAGDAICQSENDYGLKAISQSNSGALATWSWESKLSQFKKNIMIRREAI